MIIIQDSMFLSMMTQYTNTSTSLCVLIFSCDAALAVTHLVVVVLLLLLVTLK